MSNSSVLSFSSKICLLARNHSAMVRMHLSIFQFPQCSPIGLSICSINRLRQSWQNCSEQNGDPISVRIRLGTPETAMWLGENSKIISVLREQWNFASGQLILLSFEKIKFFLVLVAILNGPSKSMEISSLTFSAESNLPYWLRDRMVSKFLLTFVHSWHTLTES